MIIVLKYFVSIFIYIYNEINDYIYIYFKYHFQINIFSIYDSGIFY